MLEEGLQADQDKRRGLSDARWCSQRPRCVRERARQRARPLSCCRRTPRPRRLIVQVRARARRGWRWCDSRASLSRSLLPARGRGHQRQNDVRAGAPDTARLASTSAKCDAARQILDSLATRTAGLPFTTGGLTRCHRIPRLVVAGCRRRIRMRQDRIGTDAVGTARASARGRWRAIDTGDCRSGGATARPAKDRRRTRTTRTSAGGCDSDARGRWHQQSRVDRVRARRACWLRSDGQQEAQRLAPARLHLSRSRAVARPRRARR